MIDSSYKQNRKWLQEIYKSYVVNKENDLSLAECPRKPQFRIPMEFYISLIFHHLTLNSDLKSEICYTVQEKKIMRYRNYKENSFYPSNLSYQCLVEKIKPDCILMLVKLLLLEKKIILVRNDHSDNAIIIESLLSLIFPLYFPHYSYNCLLVNGLALTFPI